jgi:hypothetical protein
MPTTPTWSHPLPAPLQDIEHVTSLKALSVTFTDRLSVTAYVDDVVSSSARSMYAISVLWVVSRYDGASSALSRLSSRDLVTPLRRDGALRRPPTDSALMLSCVALIRLACGARLRSQTFQHSRICAALTADDEIFSKTVKFSNHIAYNTHFYRHRPPHHSVTDFDSAHTHFNFLDIPHTLLIVIS